MFVAAPQVPPRRPFVPLAVGAGAGVLLHDATVADASLWAILGLLALSAAALASILRSQFATGLLLFLAAISVGGLRAAHAFRPVDNDVGAVVQSERRLMRLVGVVSAVPLFEKAPQPSPMRPVSESRTRLRLDVEELVDAAGGRLPMGGRVVAVLPGGPSPVRRGDRVEILGWLSTPRPPASAGEWDYRAWLARQGVSATVYAESLAGLKVMDGASRWSFETWIDAVNAACRAKLARLLPGATVGAAEAAVLGARDGMRRDELDPFVHSGTLHLLVVSGWHIAIVAWAVWSICSAVRMPLAWRAGAALAAVWGYTLLTGAEAPALRAAAVASVMLAGKLLLRAPDALNSVAAAFAFVALLDPAQVFSPGTQLSFVAVLGLILFGGRIEHDYDPEESPWAARRRALAAMLWASVAAWATTAPLVAWHFHLLSLASVWLSVILAPVLAVAIGACAIALVLPDLLAAPFAGFAHGCLWFVQWSVDATDRGPGAFAFLPGPTGWWTVGAYLLLFGPFVWRSVRPLGRWHLAGAVIWSACGVVTWSVPAAPREPEFHQLAVGHGNCAVVRSGARTVVIDAGSLTNPYAGERTIAPWLWEQGVGRIDAVVVSHADADHFNALPALADRFPIGVIWLTPQFLRWPQPAASALLAEFSARGIPVKFLWQGDEFADLGVEMRVLWPPANLRPSSDNAASAVLSIAAQGRTVLSTGDLEKEGVDFLVSNDARRPDVFVLPHHGGKASNTAELAEWASPLAAICSQHERSGDTLAHYRGVAADEFRTDADGTIAVRWHAGELVVASFLTRRRLRLPARDFPPVAAPAILPAK